CFGLPQYALHARRTDHLTLPARPAQTADGHPATITLPDRRLPRMHRTALDPFKERRPRRIGPLLQGLPAPRTPGPHRLSVPPKKPAAVTTFDHGGILPRGCWSVPCFRLGNFFPNLANLFTGPALYTVSSAVARMRPTHLLSGAADNFLAGQGQHQGEAA